MKTRKHGNTDETTDIGAYVNSILDNVFQTTYPPRLRYVICEWPHTRKSKHNKEMKSSKTGKTF